MRIVFFADSYLPYISGVTTSASTLVQDLRALGHKVFVFAPAYPGHKENDPGIFRLFSFKTSYPGFRLAVPYIRNLPPADILHTHDPFHIGLLAAHFAKKRSIPLVYTFHTLFTRYAHYARFMPNWFAKIFVVAYLRYFCKKAQLIIAPTRLSKRTLKKWKIYGRCEVVPTGINIPEINEALKKTSKEELRQKLGIPQDAKVMVYLGRIAKEKNLSFLLEAFEKVRKENRYLVFIGGGPYLATLKTSAPKNVIYTGELPHATAVASCVVGDVFVFASTTETQGLVLAEAKAVGLPIVALFAGGLADTVRSGIDGYLTPRNLETFVSHVELLLSDDSLRKSMGTKAKEDAQERFSSIKIAKQIETLYGSLI